MATGGLDNDGRLDVVLANLSGLAANRFAPDAGPVGGSEETAACEGGLVVYQNQSRPRGKLLVLRLEGDESNRSGIGARVTVSGRGRAIVRELLSNVGHRGNAGLELAIGGGDQDRVNVTITFTEFPQPHPARLVIARSHRAFRRSLFARFANREPGYASAT